MYFTFKLIFQNRIYFINQYQNSKIPQKPLLNFQEIQELYISNSKKIFILIT